VFFTGVFSGSSELSGAGRHLFKMDPPPTGTVRRINAEYGAGTAALCRSRRKNDRFWDFIF